MELTSLQTLSNKYVFSFEFCFYQHFSSLDFFVATVRKSINILNLCTISSKYSLAFSAIMLLKTVINNIFAESVIVTAPKYPSPFFDTCQLHYILIYSLEKKCNNNIYNIKYHCDNRFLLYRWLLCTESSTTAARALLTQDYEQSGAECGVT